MHHPNIDVFEGVLIEALGLRLGHRLDHLMRHTWAKRRADLGGGGVLGHFGKGDPGHVWPSLVGLFAEYEARIFAVAKARPVAE
jgi:hypothetical protein